jgi:FkbM family methyltransferase
MKDMTSPVEQEYSSQQLDTLRTNYESGILAKADYSRDIWNVHRRLFEYVKFLRSTNIDAIELNEDGVVFRLREPQLKLWCTPQDQRHVAISNLNFRQYESEELGVVMRLAKACSIVFDIGANVGLYSIALAQRFQYSKVIAFEPIVSTFQELKRNLDLNHIDNVMTYNIGLSDRSCDAPFYFDRTVSGATSGAPLGPEFGPTETLICPVETLDDFVDRTGYKPDLIKCDVEGGEFQVFRGGARLFERYKPMVFTEMLRKWSKRFGYQPNEIISFFKQFGYQCFALSNGILHPFLEMTEQTVETNFFFLNSDRHLEMVRFLGLLQ